MDSMARSEAATRVRRVVGILNEAINDLADTKGESEVEIKVSIIDRYDPGRTRPTPVVSVELLEVKKL